MDSFTHAALGACLGELLLSKKLGRKAWVWGALAQSIPDVDVVAALWLPPYQNLLVHRGITHSVLFAGLSAVLLTAAAMRLHQPRKIGWGYFFLFFLVQAMTHNLLDTCTAYGTGLLEPFSSERFSFHLLYVADPLFSLWPVLALIVLWGKRNRPRPHRMRWAMAGLLLPVSYLGWVLLAKSVVTKHMARALPKPNAPFFVTPTPFNTLLWYGVANVDSGYVIGYRSVLWPESVRTEFRFYPQHKELLSAVDNPEEVAELERFADGFYTLERWQDTLVFNVLRYGQMHGWRNAQARFAFHYFLHPELDNKLVMQRGRAKGWDAHTLRQLARYIYRGAKE